MSKNILVVGGAGFVGSNLCVELIRKHPDYCITALDNLKRRGSELNIERLKLNGIQFLHGDIRNNEDLEQINQVDYIIEAAAEPSVLSGVNGAPNYVVNTNLLGSINCLNLAIKHNAKFVFLSTSRVYPIASIEKIRLKETEDRFEIEPTQEISGVDQYGLSEEFPLTGSRSLYGTTKLSTEMFIEEYAQLYNLDYVINRCGVISGPWQMGKIDQGVIVLWLAKHMWKKELKYIGFGGEGKQVRDVLHIEDLCNLVSIQIEDFDHFNANVFNVGGGLENSVSLRELTRLCEEVTGNKIHIEKSNENRIGDIKMYVTNNSKIKNHCGWEPQKTVKELLIDTYEWMLKNEKQLKSILN